MANLEDSDKMEYSYGWIGEGHLIPFKNDSGGVAYAEITYRDVYESPNFEELKIKVANSEFCYRVYSGELSSMKDNPDDFMQRNRKKLREIAVKEFELEKARSLLERVLG